MVCLLGIDIGTSSAKAVLFDADAGLVKATAGQEYPIHKPLPDRAEQDPDDWWRAALATTRQVVQGVNPAEVVGIGFSGQMHGVTLLGRDGQPVHPSIIWADQRSTETSAALTELLGAERHTEIAGTLPAVGFMGPTLLWLKQHMPDLLERSYQVVLPKDYVRLRLTGEIVTDITDAAATGLFDVSRGIWSDEIVERAALPASILPTVLPSAAVAGHLTSDAAERMGLRAGIPLVTGCADQPAQAIGNGLIDVGRSSVTTGSGGQVFTPLRRDGNHLPTDARLHVFNHAVPDRWYILGAILAAGLSLRWLRNLVGLAQDPNAYPTLSAEAAAVPVGADGLLFQPYLSGERTPHMDSLARGSFVGLSYHHGRGHLARAVMEGVACALRQALEISLGLGGRAEEIIAAGGGAESTVWRQIQADVFGLPLRQTLLKEQAGVGAALLAGVGAGVYRDIAEACRRTVRYGPVTSPDAGRAAQYQELYEQFAALYPRLRADFHHLSEFSRRVSGPV